MVEFVIDTEHPVEIPAEDATLNGLLHLPRDLKGLVLFVHGSGSSRLSPRNQSVARELQQAKFGTLLFDLLTPQEDKKDMETAEYRFDIPFLAQRLESATRWVLNNPVLRKLPLGYFGASTGGGAALVAAAKLAHVIKAVVSRGGRPDLANEALPHVQAATLLIVGGKDEQVIALNQAAYDRLVCKKKLMIVPGASHLFEEPGKLEEVSRLARDWFELSLQA